MRRRSQQRPSSLEFELLSRALEQQHAERQQMQRLALQRAQAARQSRPQQREQSEMALKDVSAKDVADVIALVKSNRAAAARLTELITSGQVEVSTRPDGSLSVQRPKYRARSRLTHP